MAIKFCDCGSVMAPSPKKKTIFKCKNCGKEEDCRDNHFLFVKNKINSKLKPIDVKKKDIEIRSVYFYCKKCANKEAEVMDAGIRYSDEDWIYLLRCTKCGYTERVGKF